MTTRCGTSDEDVSTRRFHGGYKSVTPVPASREEEIEQPISQGALDDQVTILLASEAVGRSPALGRLLRYLALQARLGHVPKEIEIAEAVFTRASSDNESDASVRVYLHRLRRKLDEFYAGAGASEQFKVVLPKGTYRLTLVAATPSPTAIEKSSDPGIDVRFRKSWVAAGIAAFLLIFAGGWLGRDALDAQDPVARVQRSQLWKPLLNGDRSIGIVLGDYFIFGESNEMGDIVRLIRDFGVQTPENLETLSSMDPKSHYVNLDLSYLPVGIADAMRSIVPVVSARAGRSRRDVYTIAASKLDAKAVSANNLVYVGYISGLRDLRYPVFGGSRFSVGSSYDEIVDRKTGKHFVADSHLAAVNRPGEDYAIVSSFRGPIGNRILVIAGTRDAALMQVARFVSSPDLVRALDAVAVNSSSIEALIGIDALDNVGLTARLIIAVARPDPSWNKGVHLNFPDSAPESVVR